MIRFHRKPNGKLDYYVDEKKKVIDLFSLDVKEGKDGGSTIFLDGTSAGKWKKQRNSKPAVKHGKGYPEPDGMFKSKGLGKKIRQPEPSEVLKRVLELYTRVTPLECRPF